jgi:hypothetical protein
MNRIIARLRAAIHGTARRREEAVTASFEARNKVALAQRRRSRRAQTDVLKDIGAQDTGGRGALKARPA